VCLPGLTYHEAWELSYFGANVLHPRTTLPAMKYDIPITIRNYFNLDAPGGCMAVCRARRLLRGRRGFH
jgi:aspartokinase/homoserine dehydrogenase 1